MLFKKFNFILTIYIFLFIVSGCGSEIAFPFYESETNVNVDDEEVVEITGGDLKRIFPDPVRPVIYVSDAGNNSVHVIDTDTNTLVKSIGVGSQPSKMDMDSIAQYLFVMNSGGSSVSVIDTSTLTVTQTINTVYSPDSIAASSSDMLFVSFDNFLPESVRGYDFSSLPATHTYTDSSGLIIVGRAHDRSEIYMHGWSTALETFLWDVTSGDPVSLGTENISSGAATYNPVYKTDLVMISPALEYWGTRFPNYDGDVPLYDGLYKQATLNVEWDAIATASNHSGSELAIAHHSSVTNSTVPVDYKHDPTPDLHIFDVSTFTQAEVLNLSDYILHNGLSYAANGDIYYLSGRTSSSSIWVIDR